VNSEYLKRDEQILPLRILQEERRTRFSGNLKDKERAPAEGKETAGTDADMTMEIDDEGGMDEMGANSEEQNLSGAKVIVIHPGSQNLRIGLASDALPKTVPMVIARKWKHNESENAEPSPKRLKLDDGSLPEPEKQFGQEVQQLAA
jgi:actin-related protein 8